MKPFTLLEVNGKRKTVYEWAVTFGIGPDTIRKRLRLGWAAVDAVQKPIDHRFCNTGHKKVNNGVEEYIANMAKYYTKEHRLRCQKQLRKDFENMQRHLQVA